MQDDQIHHSSANIRIPGEIRQFLEAMLQEAHIETVDEKSHEVMLEELFVALDKFLFEKMLAHLPVEKIEEFSLLSADPGKKDILQQFLVENIPHASDIFTSAFMEFKNEYESQLALARGKIAQNDTL